MSGRLPPDPFGRTRPPAFDNVAAIVEMLGRITVQLDELPIAIARAMRPKAGRGLSQLDRQALTTLLPLVQAALQDSNFTAAELISHVVGDEQLDTRLEQALHAAVGADGPSKSRGRRLGRLLARVEGIALDGFAVHRLCSTRTGILWKVERV